MDELVKSVSVATTITVFGLIMNGLKNLPCALEEWIYIFVYWISFGVCAWLGLFLLKLLLLGIEIARDGNPPPPPQLPPPNPPQPPAPNPPQPPAPNPPQPPAPNPPQRGPIPPSPGPQPRPNPAPRPPQRPAPPPRPPPCRYCGYRHPGGGSCQAPRYNWHR